MTDNRTTELLPCPWCGVDMKLHAINYPWADGDPGWNIWHEDMGEAGKRKCPMEMGCYDTKEEAIAAWNTRAERTCHDANIGGLFVCSECGANMKDTYVGRSYIDDWGKRWYSTSNDHAFNYCPNCGCKVVDE